MVRHSTEGLVSWKLHMLLLSWIRNVLGQFAKNWHWLWDVSWWWVWFPLAFLSMVHNLPLNKMHAAGIPLANRYISGHTIILYQWWIKMHRHVYVIRMCYSFSQLNEYETNPYFLQFFQSNTTVCLIIHLFCKSCEHEIVFVLICTLAEQFHVRKSYKTRK